VQILGDIVGSLRGADVILLGIGFPLLAYGISQWGMQRGIENSDWDYDISIRTAVIGIIGVIAFYAVFIAISLGYTQLLGNPQPDTTTAPIVGEPDLTLWVLVGLFIANGIIVPVSEELAWRGVIQTAMMDAYGVYAGVVITAITFVLKHLIVDAAAPLFRVISLVLLSFLFCGLRARYGTGASTVAHLLANSISTLLLISAAL